MSEHALVVRKSMAVTGIREQIDLLKLFHLPESAAERYYVIHDGKYFVLKKRARPISITFNRDGTPVIPSAGAMLPDTIKTNNRAVIDNVLCQSIEPGELED